ncbi:uncharacterized protein [Littorina saxatilis]|uniref:Uncharacterized protein n=1 Tax=Littorina saxatilis TaxID=31220 RepID=A0AAN9ALT1_9CAEN
MSVFSSRTSGYKAGVMILFVSAIAFFVGCATPFWYYYAPLPTYFRYDGLWMLCSSGTIFGYSQNDCSTYSWDLGHRNWLHAVRALACLSLIGLFAACVYALATNCCRSIPGPVTRILEALSAFSGVLGFVGCMVYVGETETKKYISWSLYLSAIGSALCVVAAIIIAVCNKPLPASALGGQVITMPTISQGQGYTTAGGQVPTYGNAQPYGNPQTYGNAQPYGNPQAYGNAQPYGNPQPFGNPPTYPRLQPAQTVKAGYP